MLRVLFPVIVGLFTASTALAHELWIEPEAFQNDSGAAVNASLVNGMDFDGLSLVYATRNITRLEVRTSDGLAPITGRLGDRPAIKLHDVPDGLAVIGYESKSLSVRYKTWAKFLAFAEKKGLANPEEKQKAMGLPFENFDEGYTRFSKALVAIGDGQGQDSAFGFETEIVALSNPYTDDMSNGLPVRVIYQDAPRQNALVEVYVRDADGAVSKTHVVTDDKGEVTVPVLPNHDYMLDSVVFRAPSEKLQQRMDVAWETLWANLTFSVPAKE